MQSGAQASVAVETGSAWARQDVAADALASELIVHLRGGAGGDDEGAGGGRVGQAALVSGVSGTSAGVVVVNGVTQARGRADALALAGKNVVGLAGGARGDNELTEVSVVVQAASVSGVSRASARRGVPGSAAEASLDLSALALADGGVGELGGQAQGWVDALAVALAVELLEASAHVGALTSAGDGVVDLEWVRAGSVDTDFGGVAELEGSSADAVTAVVVVGGALGRDQGAVAGCGANGITRLEASTDTAVGGGGATAWGSDTSVSDVAVGGTVGAEQDTRPVVSGGDVVLLANETEKLSGQGRGGLVNDAERDKGEASLPVTGRVVARRAKGASPVQGDEHLAVGDDRPAFPAGWAELVVGGAAGAD